MTDNAAGIGIAKDSTPTHSQESSATDSKVGNTDFYSQLNKLRRLRNFIVSQNIKEQPTSNPSIKEQPTSNPAQINLGTLNSISYGENGRQPSDSEWDDLNAKLQYFYALLSETERRKFNFTLAAPMLKATPAVLVFFSILFLVIPNAVTALGWVSFVAFLGWIVTVGALGSIAFILVNALGIQVDPTVDVTDRDSTMFRILLGALFSVILTLPFGYQSFQHFNDQILNPNKAIIDPKEATLLLMPFLFGFSTSLVLTVLNRLVESVQTFFGVSTKKPPT